MMKSSLTRRGFLKAAGIGALALTLPGCAMQNRDITPVPKHLKIGYQPSTHQVAHMIALEKGWWEKDLEKFGVEEITDYEFPSGPPEMTAMQAGELDIAYVGATPPIPAIDKGLDALIVAGAQINGSHLVLRKSINYASPSDLEGLTIATFPPGSIQDTVLKKWLTDNNIDPEKDLDIAPMGPGDAISAIKAKAVDGVFLPHPSPAIIEMEGSGKMVVGSGTMWPNHSCCVLLVKKSLIIDQPEFVKQVIRTHKNAQEFAVANQEAAAETFANKIGWEVEKVLYSLDTWDGEWIHDPHTFIPTTLEYAKVHNSMGYTDRLLEEKDLFNTELYDQV